MAAILEAEPIATKGKLMSLDLEALETSFDVIGALTSSPRAATS
jgi:hypothetical protein